jgi:hypothetical protein
MLALSVTNSPHWRNVCEMRWQHQNIATYGQDAKSPVSRKMTREHFANIVMRQAKNTRYDHDSLSVLMARLASHENNTLSPEEFSWSRHTSESI